jgi:hypothetical protein
VAGVVLDETIARYGAGYRRRGRVAEATACKAVYAGSIPAVASMNLLITASERGP